MDYEEQKAAEADALYARVTSEYERDHLDAAIVILHRLLREFKDYVLSWNVHQWLGMCYSGKLQYDVADSHLRTALGEVDCSEDKSACFDILSRLGYVNWRLAKYAESMEFYEEAERYVEENADPKWAGDRHLFRLGKGRCYVYLGKNEAALREFEKARAEMQTLDDITASDWALIDYETSRALELAGYTKEAITRLKELDFEALQRESRSDYYYTFGRCYFWQEDYRSALDQMSKVDLADFDDRTTATYHYFVGVAHFHRGDTVLARTHLRAALKIKNAQDWVHPKCREYLAKLETSMR